MADHAMSGTIANSCNSCCSSDFVERICGGETRRVQRELQVFLLSNIEQCNTDTGAPFSAFVTYDDVEDTWLGTSNVNGNDHDWEVDIYDNEGVCEAVASVSGPYLNCTGGPGVPEFNGEDVFTQANENMETPSDCPNEVPTSCGPAEWTFAVIPA
jgi:hypothetical protein